MPKTTRTPHCEKSGCPIAHALDIVGDALDDVDYPRHVDIGEA